ncbi:MAG: hypothetical protein RJQ09_19895 [Cyclobacteriaceae bacterium]
MRTIILIGPSCNGKSHFRKSLILGKSVLPSIDGFTDSDWSLSVSFPDQWDENLLIELDLLSWRESKLNRLTGRLRGDVLIVLFVTDRERLKKQLRLRVEKLRSQNWMRKMFLFKKRRRKFKRLSTKYELYSSDKFLWETYSKFLIDFKKLDVDRYVYVVHEGSFHEYSDIQNLPLFIKECLK